MVRTTSKRLLVLASFLSLAAAYPVRREVPQEHSHEPILRKTNEFLQKNNPIGIVDAVFGLLGNAAAAKGQGSLNNPDCLQTATADTAFTNAKAAGSIEGMTNALIYRALERNTGAVGQASVTCQGFTPSNPEIAALSQHQDPASQNAAAINKAITLELAKQIASIGGDPQDALLSGTFAPGKIGDPTARGNTCDDANDAAGCIFSQNLIVDDASAEEIAAAVAGVNASPPAAADSQTAAPPQDTGAANNGNNGNNNGGNNAGAGGLAGKNQNTGQCSVDGGAAPPPAGGGEAGGDNADDNAGEDNAGDNGNGNAGDNNADNGNAAATCPPPVTVTVTATAAPTATDAPAATDAPQTTAAPSATQPAPTAAPPSGTAPAAPVNTGNIAFGNCTNPSVTFGNALDGRKQGEFSFIPTDQSEFPHGSALNGAIIFDFVCDNLVNQCGLKRGDDLVNQCDAAAASVAGFAKEARAADVFNAALGFQSNFASIDVKAPPASVVAPDVGGNGKPTFRECTNPSVLFAGGLDNRSPTELTFKPVDQNEFPHGSAKNAQIIYQAVCDTLVNECGFNNQDSTVIQCRKTQQDVLPLGNVGLSADKFNAALGFTTDFCKVDNSCGA